MQCLLDVEGIELLLEFGLDGGGFGIIVGFRAAEANRGLPDALDALESCLADLLPDHVPEQAPEEPPVLAQTGLVGFKQAVGRVVHGERPHYRVRQRLQ